MWWNIATMVIFILLALYTIGLRGDRKRAANAADYWRRAFTESIAERDEALRALRYYDAAAAKRIADTWWERYRNKSRARIMDEMMQEGEEV